MKVSLKAHAALIAGVSIAALAAAPARAQVADPATAPSGPSSPDDRGDAQSGTDDGAPTATGGGDEIVVTAQRQAQSIFRVPIAVTAFSAEALDRQQVDTTSDLQLYVPNLVFTKNNFTTSNFSVRGISDLAGGLGADTAIGIHINDMPLVTSRIFETEFYDLERVEVLRGPQGTLFGRNATSGVLNIITARPGKDLAANFEAEYGNYESVRVKGMVNVPLTEWASARIAGTYLYRDGFTKNLFDGSRIDGRRLFSVRGTLRLEPTADTTINLVGQYFREKDDRSRIQKQLCNRDETGVLGCSPDSLEFEPVNGNGTLAQILTSRQFFTVAGVPAALGFSDLYSTDVFGGIGVPRDFRTVDIDFNPRYFADELIAMARLEQDFGPASLTVTGGYAENTVSSRTDYNLTRGNSQVNNPGVALFRAIPTFDAAEARLFQRHNICVSDVSRTYVGLFGGEVERCAEGSTDYDDSTEKNQQFSVEAHVDSKLDGPFNFLLGGIYLERTATADYAVASSGLDYAAAVLGGGPAFLASPFYNGEATRFKLKAYAAFGEAYLKPSDTVTITGGLRYTTDIKTNRDRQLLLNFPVPIGVPDANPFINTGGAVNFDADPNTPGGQNFRNSHVKFQRLTGRFVVDWRPDVSFTDTTLLYASYSRGYKAGGTNAGLDATIFPDVPRTYRPETINAFEVGTKNRLFGGALEANVSAFYYDYKDYQIARFIARTAINDNADAETYGIEGEFVVRPTRRLLINANASYLHTRIKSLSVVDPRDPSGGRSDVVILKDLTNASNCAVVPATAGVPRGDGLVNAVNAAVGLRPTTPIPGTNTTGAFGLCAAVAAAGAGFYVVNDGVEVDLGGNELPLAPNYKATIGAQYTIPLGSMSLVARADYAYVGSQFARNFNTNADRIPGYDVVNAQLTLNGPQDQWFLRAFVQNLENDDSITFLHTTDQASSLFTNVFTLEPRRYGVGGGFRF